MYNIKVLSLEHYINYQIILKAKATSKYQTYLQLLQAGAL